MTKAICRLLDIRGFIYQDEVFLHSEINGEPGNIPQKKIK
jgi:hypothetical protein